MNEIKKIKLDKLTFNNFLVNLRGPIKQAVVHTIHKLTRESIIYKTRKVKNEKQKKKNEHRAERYAAQIKVLKSLHMDDIAKFVSLNTKTEQEIGNNPNSSNELRALVRISGHKNVNKTVSEFRNAYSNWMEEVPPIIKVLGLKFRKTRLKRLATKGELAQGIERERLLFSLLQEHCNLDINLNISKNEQVSQENNQKNVKNKERQVNRNDSRLNKIDPRRPVIPNVQLRKKEFLPESNTLCSEGETFSVMPSLTNNEVSANETSFFLGRCQPFREEGLEKKSSPEKVDTTKFFKRNLFRFAKKETTRREQDDLAKCASSLKGSENKGSKKRTMEELKVNLHPSWAAKRMLNSAAIDTFQGKIIKFD